MNENPYSPPGIREKAEMSPRPDYCATEETASPGRRKRPLAVKILCGLYSLQALLGVWSTYLLIDFLLHMTSGTDPSDWIITGVICGIPLLLMFVGIPGLWLGRGWGFFALGFSSAIKITSNITFLLFDLPSILEITDSNLVPRVFYTLAPLGVRILAFCFLLTPPVLVYCGRPVGRRWLYFAVLLMLGAAWVAGVTTILVYLVLYLTFAW